MIKAVLFDMDGVLYDSMPSHARAWYEIMTGYGAQCSPEDFYLYEGRTGHSTIDIFFNKDFGRNASLEEKEEIYTKKSELFSQLDSAQPMNGALDVLTRVKMHELDRIIVTGSGQFSLFDKLNTHFSDFFNREKMVTAYDVQWGKPHPEPYLMGLKKAGVNANEAIAVENAPLGVESAVAAGIFTVAVNTGPLPDKVLTDAGAHCIYPSMKALADDFDNLLNNLQNN